MTVARLISPPPCDQECWEYVTVPGQTRPAWVWIRSSESCGHRYDPDQRIWRWNNRPTQETH